MIGRMQGQGIFITFEGGEGAGKTTLINEMARQLEQEGHHVLKTREPGGTRLGEEIRKLLLEHNEPISPYTELSLFLASRAQHVNEVIGPALLEGKVVLCDRFNDSSVAYQGAARGLGMQQVEEFCHFISQGVEPRLTFYLDLDPEVGLMRAAKERKQDRIESETLIFHQKIREAYLSISRAHPRRFYIISASLPPAKVFEEAMKRVHAYV